jgi:hypothetical protein
MSPAASFNKGDHDDDGDDDGDDDDHNEDLHSFDKISVKRK